MNETKIEEYWGDTPQHVRDFAEEQCAKNRARMAREKGMNCKRPDHKVPELICGNPLPCPWHTVLIDATKNPATITVPVTAAPAPDPALLERLQDIGMALTK